VELNPPSTLGKQARASVRSEGSSGKPGEIDDDRQEKDFAGERQAVPGSPKAVQPKE
jgi:hypothetical protein